MTEDERWIARPGDVARLSNALNFSWAALEGEIDAQDLLAMESLRLFDPIGPYLERFHYRLLGPDAAKPTGSRRQPLDRGPRAVGIPLCVRSPIHGTRHGT